MSERKRMAIESLKSSSEFLRKWLEYESKFESHVSPWEEVFWKIIKAVDELGAK